MEEKDVINLDLNELWNLFNVLLVNIEDSDIDLDKLKNDIVNGINIKIPFYYFLNEWYEVNPSNKNVKVYGFGKFDIVQFFDELEERKTLMRNFILDNLSNEDIFISRV